MIYSINIKSLYLFHWYPIALQYDGSVVFILYKDFQENGILHLWHILFQFLYVGPVSYSNIHSRNEELSIRDKNTIAGIPAQSSIMKGFEVTVIPTPSPKKINLNCSPKFSWTTWNGRYVTILTYVTYGFSLI